MDDEKRKPVKITGWHLLAIFAGVAVVWLGFWFVPLLCFHDPAAAATWGDMFGAVNALFSGLAFAGLLVTLLMQREELALQRDEMRQMREQYERTACAQEASEQLLRDQVAVTSNATRVQAMASLVDLAIANATHGVNMHAVLPPLEDIIRDLTLRTDVVK